MRPTNASQQSSSLGQRPTPRRGNTRRGGSRQRAINPASSWEDRRVWGRAPPSADLTQSNLIRLFERQRLLKADLARQARLAKLDVSEVRSTQVEHLRQINQAILDGSASALGAQRSELERNLTDVQLLTEDMIRRSGKRTIGGEPVTPLPKPSPPSTRRRVKIVPGPERPIREPPLEACFTLRGPLVSAFRRAKDRGFKGRAESWIQGSRAVCLTERLRRKGFTLPAPGKVDLFDPISPLYWAVNSRSGIAQHNRRTGFQSERLDRKPTDWVVLRRQAASVQRLRLSDWPRSPRANRATGGLVRSWPTFPTLNESWEMMVRAKKPHHIANDTTSLASSTKVPTKQVLPGSSARAVNRFLIGIRADIEVDKKFLSYFRYRWGFLILHRRGNLPRALVSKLTEVWKKDIFRTFLVMPIRYNDALRRMPASTNWSMRGFLSAGVSSEKLPPSRSRAPKRKRPGKGARVKLRELRAAGLAEQCSVRGPPSSDKSDDSGVRLQ